MKDLQSTFLTLSASFSSIKCCFSSGITWKSLLFSLRLHVCVVVFIHEKENWQSFSRLLSRHFPPRMYPESRDLTLSVFFVFLDFQLHFNSNKRITAANQNSRLSTYNNTTLILKTTEWMIYKVLSLYYLHLFPLLAALSLLGWL